MAGKWEGFTEEDIGYYLNTKPETTELNTHNIKSANFEKIRKVRRERGQAQSTKETSNNGVISEEAMLLKPKTETIPEKVAKTASIFEAEPTVLVSESPVRQHLLKKTTAEEAVPVVTESLEEFQTRQRLLEEQNRQRKLLLSKVLSDRKKRTTDEARRLQAIQQELHVLDVQLSTDVGILRNEIEVATMEFGDAQKRFSHAEKEFLEAKQNLFTKLDRKELLTRHLCTIIEQNEVRKAQKLSELMDKLSVEQEINELSNEHKEHIKVVEPTPNINKTSTASDDADRKNSQDIKLTTTSNEVPPLEKPS